MKADQMKEQGNYPGPAIVVIVYKRARSLVRLLTGLNAAHYDHPVQLIISIDHGDNQHVLDAANSFEWDKGSKEVIYHPENLGIKNHIMACGDLTERFGSVIVLEDDLFVSPEFYRFSEAAEHFYRNDSKVAGIGLYKNTFNNENKTPFRPIPDQGDALFIQYTCTWGQLWNRDQWRKFRNWYDVNDRVDQHSLLPKNIIKWDSYSAWDKDYNYYLVENDLYYVYPQVSLSANLLEPGIHFTGNEGNHSQAPLLLSKKSFFLQSFDESYSKYDIFWELSSDTIKKLVPVLENYDFEVDLLGTKPVESITKDYILTTRPVSSSIMAFDKILIPFEMNILMGLEGNKIALALKSHLIDEAQPSNKLIAFHYSYLSGRKLMQLLMLKVGRKLRAKLGYKP